MFALTVLLLVAGCHAYKVQVDSLAREGAEAAISYRIENKTPGGEVSTPSPEEAAAYLRTALSGRGFYEAPTSVKPDVVVVIDYGISPRQERRFVSEPVYSEETRRVVEHGNGDFESVPPPIKYVQKTIVVITYEKYLRLTAGEDATAAADRPAKGIWRVDVTSVGQSDDLAKYLPVLMAASIDYIGRDSHGVKKIKLKDSDADVQFVKKGM